MISIANNRLIQVIIVEDHSILRRAISKLVSEHPNINVISSLNKVDELLEMEHRDDIYVIVLGTSVVFKDCLSLLQILKEMNSRSKVISLQVPLTIQSTLTLIKQGISGLLDKDALEEDLLQAILNAESGNAFFSKYVQTVLASSDEIVDLTFRETQILSLLVQGASNYHIAKALNLKEKTIEAYLTKIYRKLGVNSRAQALLQAQQLYFQHDRFLIGATP